MARGRMDRRGIGRGELWRRGLMQWGCTQRPSGSSSTGGYQGFIKHSSIYKTRSEVEWGGASVLCELLAPIRRAALYLV